MVTKLETNRDTPIGSDIINIYILLKRCLIFHTLVRLNFTLVHFYRYISAGTDFISKMVKTGTCRVGRPAQLCRSGSFLQAKRTDAVGPFLQVHFCSLLGTMPPGRKRKEPPTAEAPSTVPVVEVINVLGDGLMDGAIADDAPAAVVASSHMSTPVATVLFPGTECLRHPPASTEATAGKTNKHKGMAHWNREERWVSAPARV